MSALTQLQRLTSAYEDGSPVVSQGRNCLFVDLGDATRYEVYGEWPCIFVCEGEKFPEGALTVPGKPVKVTAGVKEAYSRETLAYLALVAAGDNEDSLPPEPAGLARYRQQNKQNKENPR